MKKSDLENYVARNEQVMDQHFSVDMKLEFIDLIAKNIDFPKETQMSLNKLLAIYPFAA